MEEFISIASITLIYYINFLIINKEKVIEVLRGKIREGTFC